MWLRRRLGCAGVARLRIVEAVRADLAGIDSQDQVAPGWDEQQLAAFCVSARLEDIARHVRGRGDAVQLARIAWWGSALADLGPGTGAARLEALEIGAAFNLAVALFDTAIDEAPIPRLALVEALAPQRLAQRLKTPGDDNARLRSEHAAAACVVHLFDRALALAAMRHAGEPQRIERLCAMLDAMYRSVLGQGDDPFVAKTGPVMFIGEVASGGDIARARPLYAALARLCQVWDDALDIAEDLTALAPNHFLGKGRGIDVATTVAYLARGLARVSAGAVVHGHIERELAAALAATLEAAHAWHPLSHARSLQLCRTLLN
ncbi:MAG: hypothetical protein IPG43_23775 [Proteobacteria bacterium]|nr:hypothetical protein [Pseudomonadota bacterium]